jgi:two-component system alkaline phosphatase synthesis response regulator PhoP
VKQKVLLVDDEEVLRRVMARGLERHGYSVIQSDNGEEALKIAQQESPSLIILDLVMPGLLGFEVCATLRRDERFRKTPIIIMSAKSYKPDIEKAKELGADAYVVKPIEIGELVKLAQEHLDKRTNLS